MLRHVLWGTFALSLTCHCKPIYEPVPGTGACEWTPLSDLGRLVRNTCQSPIDSEIASSRGSWEPWSFPPLCIKLSNRTVTDKQYCTFTYHFSPDNAISLVTTPDSAAVMLEKLEDINILPELRASSSAKQRSEKDANRSYTIEDVPGRGKGVIARRRIPRSEIVMKAYPTLIVKLEVPQLVTKKQETALLERAVYQLPVHQQTSVLTLAQSMGGGVIQDVLATNNFGIAINGVSHRGLFPDGSVSFLPGKY
jgi:hypothetical protein